MIADMVKNFLLPEVDKQMLKKKILQRQQRYLREAHSAIYNEMEKLSPEKKNPDGSSEFQDERFREDHEEHEKDLVEEDAMLSGLSID